MFEYFCNFYNFDFLFYQNIYHIRYSENETKSDGISQIFFN